MQAHGSLGGRGLLQPKRPVGPASTLSPQGHLASTRHPVFRSEVVSIDLSLCFVLMPFTEAWSDGVFRRLRDVVESLRIQGSPLQCLRADNADDPIVMEDVWVKINQAAFLIADVTGRNPNVMYELGIAHARGTAAVLDSEGQLSQDAIPDVPKFLNRLLSLRVGVMDAVFDSWYGYLEEATESAKEAGTLDVGVETIQAERTRKTSEEHVYTQPRTGAVAHVVRLEITKKTDVTAWEEVWRKAREAQALGFFAGFALNRRSGQAYALFRAGSRTTETGQVVERVRRIGVRSNRLFDGAEVEREGKTAGYRPARPSEAERLWETEVLAAPDVYTEEVYLVTGAVLPIWDRIAGPPRVYRAQTEAGERMIGRVIAPDHLAATLKALGAESRKIDVVPEELARRLMNGIEAELANGWMLRRRRVAGEHRIELVGPVLAVLGELESDGVFCEIHQFKTRFFVPAGERAPEVLRRIVEHRPVVDVREPKGAATRSEPGMDGPRRHGRA